MGRKKLNIEDIRKRGLVLGLELLSDTYINNVTLLKWKSIATGNEFFRRWNDVRNGYITDYNLPCPNITDTSYEETKSYIENYKGIGFKLQMTKKEYYEARKYSNGTRILCISHPNLYGDWNVGLSNFKKHAEKHAIQLSGESWGELIIRSILVNNHVMFKPQKVININGEEHRFDFCCYVNNNVYYIEYDGRQHFEPVSYFGGQKALKNRIKKDKEKDDYVKSQENSYMIRISYETNDTQERILEILENNFGTTLNKGKLITPVKTESVAKYYQDHTVKETASYFKIPESSVSQCYKKVFGKNKLKNRYVTYVSADSKLKICDYYRTHSILETMNKYNISKNKVIRYYKEVNGKVKKAS